MGRFGRSVPVSSAEHGPSAQSFMANAAYHSIVYGPVKSRRLGSSLGINPVPSSRESCDSTCLYCQKGTSDSVPILSRTNQAPSAGVIVTSAARRIIEMSKAGEKLDSVTVAGNCDPTLHPSLLEIAENLRDLRNKWFPKADLSLISDSTNVGPDEVRRALRVFDRPILRFEWPSQKIFTAMTGKAAADYKAICEALHGLDRLIVQATFGPQNSADADLKSWVKKVEELRPKEVQILTTETAGKKGAKTKSISLSKLEDLAQQLTEKTGVPATVYARETQPA
jgi:wyosine [tRNA(Phe)-imidazoG37] synthetase (radical SAM superfamily)